jgi:hypothetical protein
MSLLIEWLPDIDVVVHVVGIVLPDRDAPPSLEVLSLIDSHLTDGFLKTLQGLFEGRQIPLIEIDISSNNELTEKVVHFISELTTGINLFPFFLYFLYSIYSTCTK